MSSITKKGEIESASRPLIGFGELNDKMIKGLMLYLRYHEQGFICISIRVLTHVLRNQIKESLLLKVKHVVIRKKRQVLMCYLMVSKYDLSKWSMLCLKGQRFVITKQDKEMKIWEWNKEFIVDVQSFTQHGKGKWWRS